MYYGNKSINRMFELISSIHIKNKRNLDIKLKEYKLTSPQYSAMSILLDNSKITQRKLANIMETDSTNIMVICDSLEKKGLLQRNSDPKDRRSNLLVITEKGKKVHMEIFPVIEEMQKKLNNLISPLDISTVTPILKKLHNSL